MAACDVTRRRPSKGFSTDMDSTAFSACGLDALLRDRVLSAGQAGIPSAIPVRGMAPWRGRHHDAAAGGSVRVRPAAYRRRMAGNATRYAPRGRVSTILRRGSDRLAVYHPTSRTGTPPEVPADQLRLDLDSVPGRGRARPQTPVPGSTRATDPSRNGRFRRDGRRNRRAAWVSATDPGRPWIHVFH